MDYDTTSGKDGHGKILEEFRSGRARILIGTQMIAKGLDFPQVTLVGVIAADLALNLPDYRSRERAFQLFTQVAGRAGRGSIPGRVIIQTYKPDDPVIGFAARQDYRAFFESEFRRRRNGLYPPFTNLARLLIESPNEENADRKAREAETFIRKLLENHPEWQRKILSVVNEPPSVQMLRGKHRRQVLMKTLVSRETDEFFSTLSEMTDVPTDGADIYLEVNPTTMI
jgi:primosomal protein N' (replication factor Y)